MWHSELRMEQPARAGSGTYRPDLDFLPAISTDLLYLPTFFIKLLEYIQCLVLLSLASPSTVSHMYLFQCDSADL